MPRGLEYREKEKLDAYLKTDDLDSYMINVVRMQYISQSFYSIPEICLPMGTSDVIKILDELSSSSKGQLLGIKPKYIETLKKFLQSDDKVCYYTALEFIYCHLLLETHNCKLAIKLSDDTELYKIFKGSIHRNIDYLRMVTYGLADGKIGALYEIAQKVDKMFCSALEQHKLSAPE